MPEPHLRMLRVKRAAVDVAAAGAAQDQRRGRSPQIVAFRDHVADLVHGASDEIHELKFGDGAHPGKRSSKGRAHDSGLGDGRVDHARGPEAVNNAVGNFERPAVDADIFADAEYRGIAFHLFPDSLADGFQIGELRHRSESLLHSELRRRNATVTDHVASYIPQVYDSEA